MPQLRRNQQTLNKVTRKSQKHRRDETSDSSEEEDDVQDLSTISNISTPAKKGRGRPKKPQEKRKHRGGYESSDTSPESRTRAYDELEELFKRSQPSKKKIVSSAAKSNNYHRHQIYSDEEYGHPTETPPQTKKKNKRVNRGSPTPPPASPAGASTPKAKRAKRTTPKSVKATAPKGRGNTPTTPKSRGTTPRHKTAAYKSPAGKKSDKQPNPALSDEIEDGLANWLAANPCIWDTADEGFRNRPRKDALFDERAEEIPGDVTWTGPMLYTWYQSARTTYGRELKKEGKSGDGAEDNHRSDREKNTLRRFAFLECVVVPKKKSVLGVSLEKKQRQRARDNGEYVPTSDSSDYDDNPKINPKIKKTLPKCTSSEGEKMLSVMKEGLKMQNEKLTIAATQMKDECFVYGRHVADKMKQMDTEGRLALVEQVDALANVLLRETYARKNMRQRERDLPGLGPRRPSDFNIPPRNFDMYTTPQMYQQMAQPVIPQNPLTRQGSYPLPYVNGQLFKQQQQQRRGQPRPIRGIVATPLCGPLLQELIEAPLIVEHVEAPLIGAPRAVTEDNVKDIQNFDLNEETNNKTSTITCENEIQEKTPQTPKMPKK